MIKLYVHVPEMPGWQKMLVELLESMNSSNLVDAVDEIELCGNGVRSNMEMSLLPILRSNSKFKLVQVNGDAAKGEWPTLNKLKTECDETDTDNIVGYAHLKGLSQPDNPYQTDWRHYLTYWTLERWQEYFDLLAQGKEIVGVNWMDQPWPHFSGNSWWAKSNYIRRLNKLQDPATIKLGVPSEYLTGIVLDPGNYRYEHEAWTGSGNPNWAEVHRSHSAADTSFHYNNLYPPSKYK